MLYMPRPAIGGVGLAYRAWNSVVFLLGTGIAKPLMSVKNRRTSRFLYAYTLKIVLTLPRLDSVSLVSRQSDLNKIYIETKKNISGECRKPNNKVEAKLKI